MQKIYITSQQARRLSSKIPLGLEPVILPNGAKLVREVENGKPKFAIASSRNDGTDVDAIEASIFADEPVTLKSIHDTFEKLGTELQLEDFRQAWVTNEKLVVMVRFWRPTRYKLPMQRALNFIVGSIRGNLDGELSPKNKTVPIVQGMITATMVMLKEHLKSPTEQKGTR